MAKAAILPATFEKKKNKKQKNARLRTDPDMFL